MKPTIRLEVHDGSLCLPGSNIPLVHRYQEGDMDRVTWPDPNLAHLRGCLFDARETGDMAYVPGVLLPDGTTFWIDEKPAEDTWKGVYPGMCINPEICRGHSHCPRNYSCCE